MPDAIATTLPVEKPEVPAMEDMLPECLTMAVPVACLHRHGGNTGNTGV